MILKRSILRIILWILINVQYSISQECNLCAAALNLACVTDTQYQFCTNSLPSGMIYTCPANYVCWTTTTEFCQPAGTITPTCAASDCNVCDSGLNFACTGINTYELCLGTTTPVPATAATCGTGLVCNINNVQICGNPLEGITASCPTIVTPNITIPSTLPTYAQFLCSQIAINARFAIPTIFDNTCKKFIYCFRTTNATWSGQIYSCAGATYFDSNSRYCVDTLPTNCLISF